MRYLFGLLVVSIIADISAIIFSVLWALDLPLAQDAFPCLALVTILLNLYYLNEKINLLLKKS